MNRRKHVGPAWALAAAATVLLAAHGDLLGPVFWQDGPDAPVVFEHVLFAGGGAVIGLMLSLRRASRAPTATGLNPG